MSSLRFDIRVLGDKPLSKAMRKLPEKVERKVLRTAMRTAFKTTLERAKAKGPVHSGALKRSLKLRAIEGAYLPTRKSTYEDSEVLEANPHFARFFEVFRNTRNRPRSPNYPRASDIIQENVHGALAGETAPRAAARAIVSELSEI